jgi:hypothetical protein
VADAVDGARTVIVTTPDKVFVELPRHLAGRKDVTVIDCWRILSPADFDGRLVQIGRGEAATSTR